MFRINKVHKIYIALVNYIIVAINKRCTVKFHKNSARDGCTDNLALH